MVRLAREARGLTQTALASEAGVSQAYISQVENGDREPDPVQTDRIAEALDRPVTFFTQADPITRGGISDFYHRKRSTAGKRDLNQIHAGANVLRMEIARLLELVDVEPEIPIPDFDPAEFDSATEVARACRATWRLPRGPVHNMVELLERTGAVVAIRDLPSRKLDAVTQWHRSTPIVVLNAAYPASRMRWTLAHELGHLVMHRTPADPSEAERDADEFAAEFLMPADDILESLRSHRLTLERAVNLKQHWRTSMAAIARHANRLGAITDRQYRTFFTEKNKRGYSKNEPGEFDREEPALARQMIEALVSSGWTITKIAEHLNTPEREIRVHYLGEAAPPRLKVVRTDEPPTLFE